MWPSMWPRHPPTHDLHDLIPQVRGVEGEISDLQSAAQNLDAKLKQRRSAVRVAVTGVEEVAGRMRDLVNDAREDQVGPMTCAQHASCDCTYIGIHKYLHVTCIIIHLGTVYVGRQAGVGMESQALHAAGSAPTATAMACAAAAACGGELSLRRAPLAGWAAAALPCQQVPL